MFDGASWHGVSQEAKNFVKSLLTYDEDKRATANQALEHPWIQKRRVIEDQMVIKVMENLNKY